MINNVLWSLAVGVIVFFANLFWAQHRKNQSMQEKLKELEKSLAQIAKDHPVLIHADLLFSKQVSEINTQLVSMDKHIQNLENKRHNDGGYQHAIKILEMGGNREEIEDSCHLSPAESEFLMNLQSYRSAMRKVEEF